MVQYTTTLEAIQTVGLGEQVELEEVGTGDNAQKSFDLDNGNVIDNSYTLSYGAATGNDTNDLTALTETTHYTLDKNAGTVLLTASGVTVLGTNKLYASYVHSPNADDDTISDYIDAATVEVEKLTGKYWGPVKSSTKYFDWDKTFTYPTTDQPYATSEYDEPDELNLEEWGIQSVDAISILSPGTAISKAWRYDTTAGTYTDVTSEANSHLGSAFQPFADTTAADDYLYIGFPYIFKGLTINMFTLGVTGSDNTIEYYDGSSWIAFTPTESATGVLNFEANGKLSWSDLSGWTKTTVNSSGSLYYIRIVAGGTYSTEAKINHIYADQDSIVQDSVPLYQISFGDKGRIVLNNYRLPSGRRNIRVDYTHGYSETPELAKKLCEYIVGIMGYARLTGGSYDDATSFQVGRKSISVGEVYVNVREAVRQFEVKRDAVLRSLGPSIGVY